MHALRILPALMSVLAMAISLLASDCIGGIIAADLAMLADVHAIIAADAGENARTESAAETIKAVFIWTSLQSINQTGVMPAWQLRLVAADGFAGGRLQAGGRWNGIQGFGLAGMLPVAISAVQEARPRSDA